MIQRCEVCRAEAKPGARFCRMCGNALPEGDLNRSTAGSNPVATQQNESGAFQPSQDEVQKHLLTEIDDRAWFYMKGRRRAGPIPGFMVYDLADAGDITAETMLWNPGLPEWASASELGFAPSLPSLPAAPQEQSSRRPAPTAPAPPFPLPKAVVSSAAPPVKSHKPPVRGKKRLKPAFILAAIVLLVVLGAYLSDNASSGRRHLPAKPPAARETTGGREIEFRQGGVAFSYPRLLAGGAVLETVAASTTEGWLAHPGYTRVTLRDYMHKDTFSIPAIDIYPLDQYRLVNSYADDSIELLEALLDNLKDIRSVSILPFLPEQNAVQLFHTNVRLIDSRDVRGLRYLAQYVQDVSPVTNASIFYTFQGISADRRHYISMVMPVSHPDLPADWDHYFTSINHDYSAFEDGYHAYLTETLKLLEETGDEVFSPSLTLLDNLIITLRVE